MTSLDDNLTNLSLDDGSAGGPTSPAQQLLTQLFEEVKGDSKDGAAVGGKYAPKHGGKGTNSPKKSAKKQTRTAALRDTVGSSRAGGAGADKEVHLPGAGTGGKSLDSQEGEASQGAYPGQSYSSTYPRTEEEEEGDLQYDYDGLYSRGEGSLVEHEEEGEDRTSPGVGERKDGREEEEGEEEEEEDQEEEEEEVFAQLEGAGGREREENTDIDAGGGGGAVGGGGASAVRALVADVAEACVDRAASHVLNCTIEKLELLLQQEQEQGEGNDLDSSVGSIPDAVLVNNGYKSVKSLKKKKSQV